MLQLWVEGYGMKEEPLFNDFDSLEEAFTSNMISMDTFLNEYNRLIEEEADKMQESTPTE